MVKRYSVAFYIDRKFNNIPKNIKTVEMYPRVRFHNIARVSTSIERRILPLVAATLAANRVPRAVELHVSAVTPIQMQVLNSMKYGPGHSKTTDVLTFPGSGSNTNANQETFSLLFDESDETENDIQARVTQRKEFLDLGDIFICPAYIQRKIDRFPHKNLCLEQYYVAALVHATLHALGYDHVNKEDWDQMVLAERQTVAKLRRWQTTKGFLLLESPHTS